MAVKNITAKSGTIETSTRKVRDLKIYPLQKIHTPRPAAEELAFQESIAANGVQEPVDVMPANNAAGVPENTVPDGNRRVAAAQKLNILNLTVRVRHDLATLTRKELDAVFLRASIDRRNLSQVDLAFFLFELNANQAGTQIDYEDPMARKFVAQRMGVDLRTVSRYARLFRAPDEIRMAVSRGHLSVVMGEKVADLGAAAQKKLAVAVAACDNANEVTDLVQKAIPKNATSPGRAARVADRRLTLLVEGLSDLADKVDRIGNETLLDCLPALLEGAALIASLIKRAKSKKDLANWTESGAKETGTETDSDADELPPDGPIAGYDS